MNRLRKWIGIAGLMLAVTFWGGNHHIAQAAPEGALPTTDESFEDWGYGDRTAYSMFGALEYYFPIPENWTLQEGTQLNLVLSHSPLLKPDRSTMTVIVNDMAIHSGHLDETNQDRANISIDLPVHIFQDDSERAEGYVVLIQLFMRLTDEICEETNNPALWATIHQDSTLTLVAEPRPITDDLALLPYPLIVKNALDQNSVTFSFDRTPANDDLNAAGQVAAYLGSKATQDLIEFQVHQDSTLAAQHPSVAVGYSPAGTPATAPSALEFQAHDGQAVLSLQGTSPLLSSRALRHPDYVSQLVGQRVEIRSALSNPTEAELWPWKFGAATFWQLGVYEQTVRGVGQQSLFLFFERPAGWQLNTDEIYLDLHLTPSPMLLLNQSGVKVRINGIDVGAISYAEQPGEGDFYRIPLPADLMNISPAVTYTADLMVELVFEHQLQQEGCEPIYAENAWTTVHSNSYFYFPHTTHKLPDLSVFPYPFLDPQENTPVWIVLPDTPSDQELASALLVSQILGKFTFNPWQEINLTYASEIEALDENTILIGTAERNSWVAQAEAELPPSQQRLVQTIVTQDAIGNLKEFESPWSGDKWVLIVAGPDDLGILAAALNSQIPSASIVAVRADGSLEPVNREVPAPRIPEPYRQPRATLLPKPATWQIVLGVLGLTVLVSLTVIFIYRRRS